MIKVSSSILAADFSKLGDDIKSAETSDYLHFDVMDGIFVPNISFGIPVLESVRKFTDMTLDVHLMIDRPVRFVKDFAEAGADIIVFHTEADTSENTKKALETVRSLGKKAGLAIKPATPVSAVREYIPFLDMVLVMTVEPGFGGQHLIEDTLKKVAEVRRIIDDNGYECDVEVDGGINEKTAAMCVSAGANVLVAGSCVFKAPDRAQKIDELRNCL